MNTEGVERTLKVKKRLEILAPTMLSILLLYSYGGTDNVASAGSNGSQGKSRIYTVSKGDSLRSIAKKLYGETDKWELIFDANRNLKYADMIKPGTKLTVPLLNNPPNVPDKTRNRASGQKLEHPYKYIEHMFPIYEDLSQWLAGYRRKDIVNEMAVAIAPSGQKTKKSLAGSGDIVWSETRNQEVECVGRDGKRHKRQVTYHQNSIGMKFVYLDPLRETASDNLIKLAFYMGATEVTHRQWKEIMGVDGNIGHFKGDDFPMKHVTWHQASEFCNKLGRKEGKSYRLPTEAEWEHACRARTATRYSCGDTISTEFSNFRPSHGTKPVGSYPANVWGIYDMHGNVSEWCIDEYRIGQKIMRGGSYRSYPKDLESGNSAYSSPNDGSTGNGFRVVVEIE